MNFFEAIKSVYSKYAVFSGRARRSEYWFFALFNALVFITFSVFQAILYNFDSEIALMILGAYGLGNMIPGLALNCRRLHDIGKSGANILFAFIPFIGSILILVWALQDSEPCDNQYGANPKTAFASKKPTQNGYYSEESSNYTVAPDNSWASSEVTETIAPEDNCAVLRCISGQYAGAELPLDAKGIVIGRASSACNLVYDKSTQGISRVHCQVKYSNGVFSVTDLGSSYGSFLDNGQKIPANIPQTLPNGACFYLYNRENTFMVCDR